MRSVHYAQGLRNDDSHDVRDDHGESGLLVRKLGMSMGKDRWNCLTNKIKKE